MNLAWFQYLNGLAGSSLWFDALVIFLAKYLGYLTLAGLGSYLLFKQEKKILKMTVFALVSALIARLFFTEIIRAVYFHPRPFTILNDIWQLIAHSPNASLPSGHAAFFFALAMGIYFFNKRLSILFFAGAFLIGISRVISSIHWPFDILAGAIVGIFTAILLRYLWHRFRYQHQ